MRFAEDQNSKYIQHQLGHASIQTTLDRYGHLMPDSNQEQAKVLDSRLGFSEQKKDFVRRMLEDC
ncbi:MAG: integrase [Deltaproteobacteria bacterium]|nr:integrase [Deltaproteobacteria bacterium]